MTKEELFFKIGWKATGAFAWFMWVVGSFLSYWGFTHLSAVPLWVKVVAGGFAIGINIVEFVLNRMTMEELMSMDTVGDAVLRLFGVVCYIYDCWSNILGFMLVFGYATFMVGWNSDITMTIFAVIFGIAFAIGPEPLYIRYLHEMEKLKSQGSRQSHTSFSASLMPNVQHRKQYKPSYKPSYKPLYPSTPQDDEYTPLRSLDDTVDGVG